MSIMVEAVIHDTAAEYQFVIYSLLYQLNLKPLAGATLLARVKLLARATPLARELTSLARATAI